MKSESKRDASPVACDFAALRAGRTVKARQRVSKCTNLLWFDLARLGHFYTNYKDITDLKLQFRDQLDKLLEEDD